MDGEYKVALMIGTSLYVRDRMLNGEYNPIVWATDSLETVAHYFEGAVVEITVRLDDSLRSKYVRDAREWELISNPKTYGWGVAERHYPDGLSWYSFSREYLQKYMVIAKEIFPDLTPWQEGDSDCVEYYW